MQRAAVHPTFALRSLCLNYTTEQDCISMGNHLKAVTGVQFKAVPWQVTTFSCDKIGQKNTNQTLFVAVTTPSAYQEVAAHLPLAFTIAYSFQNAINYICVIL